MITDRQAGTSAGRPGAPGRTSAGLAAFLLYAAFFFSGAAGLIYEIAWAKALGVLFGSTVYAVTAVLAAFMGGLALGSWALGRRLEGHARPALAFAGLEAGIAVAAPLTFAALPLLREIYFRTGGETGVRFASSLLLLLVPTFLMGGSFPVLVRVFRAGEEGTGNPVSKLYALNTAGAVTGTLAAGFVMLPYLGILRTAFSGAACNLLAAALASGAAFQAAQTRKSEEAPAPALESLEATESEKREQAPALQTEAAPGELLQGTTDDGPGRIPAPGLPGAGILRVAFLSGAASMILEVAWTRLLAAPLGSSTYAFTVLLAAFLIGIAVGSRWFVRLARESVGRANLAALQLVMALVGLLALALWRLVPSLVFDLMEFFGGAAFGMVVVQFLAAFLILLPPALLFGVNFPWMAALYAPEERGVGARVGRLYAVNTAGAIAGAVVTGFVLVPRLGSFGALAVAVGVNGLTAGLLLSGGILRREEPWRFRWPPVAALAGVAVLLLGAAGAGLLRHSPLDQEGVLALYFHEPIYHSGLSLGEIAAAQDYLFMEDGLNANVAVSRSGIYHYLKINGKTDASELDMRTQVMLAVLPLAMHPAPRRVLVIGFGAGVTTRVAAMWPGVERVDTVEIEPAVLRAAPYLKELNGEVYRNPRSRIILDDARHFLFTTSEQYDVIISEPSNPWMAGVGNLFTTEFYREARARLATGGVFTQWVQGYQLLPEDLALIARTMADAFPPTTLWRAGAVDFLLVAAPAFGTGAGAGTTQQIHFPNPAFQNSPQLRHFFWEQLKIDRPEQIWAYFLLGRTDLERFAGSFSSTERNTDDRPVLEYRAPWRLLRQDDNSLRSAVDLVRKEGLPVALSPEQRLAVAEAMLRIGEVGPSRNLARPLLQVIPDSPGIWLYAGDLNRILPNRPVAETCYRKALARGGGARALAGLAMVAAETGSPEAEARLRGALDAAGSSNEPYVAELLAALTRTLAHAGRWPEAIPLQKRLIATDQAYPSLLWAQLGELYLRTGDKTAAQEAFDKSLALDPYNYATHRVMGDIFLASGRATDAVREYRLLLRYHPLRDPSLYERAAEALRKTGRYREADSVLARARRIFPQPVEAQ